MSFAKIKKALNLFSSTAATLREVKQNIQDDIYRGLGITQAIWIFTATASWLTLMFPENGLSPMQDMYAYMYNVTKDEINTPNTSQLALNYVIWAVGAILFVQVGDKLGKLTWGTYCLMRTGCHSHHTMDLPLTRSQHDRVRNNFLPYIRHDLDHSDQSTRILNDKRKDIRHWVNAALLFYSSKKDQEKGLGKIESSHSWWKIKKDFRNRFNGIKLYQKLRELYDKLDERIVIVSKITSSLQNLLDNSETPESGQLIILINDALQYFEQNIIMSPDEQKRAPVNKDYVAINKTLNLLLNKTRPDTKNATRQFIAILNNVKNKLLQEQQKIPLGPTWMKNALSQTMSGHYLEHSRLCTLENARTIGSDLCHIDAEQREHHISTLSALFTQQIELTMATSGGNDRLTFSDRMSPLNQHHRVNSSNSLLDADSVSIKMSE